jgi:probable HAF family extracellular repeat protein
MTKRFVVSLAALTLVLYGATRVRAEYIITDLGAFPGGKGYATGSDATGINDSGQVVGWSTVNGNAHMFLYSGGKLADLGTVAGTSTTPTGINDAGQVVGTTYVNGPVGGASSGFLYSDGKMTGLSSPGVYVTSATGINASGQVTGSANGHAFLYSNGKFTDLGSLGGPHATSSGTGINASGQVVGTSYSDNFSGTLTARAFLYSGGKMTDLGSLGGPWSQATAINASGQVIGQSQTASGAMHSFLYSGGKMTDLGTFNAMGINDAGSMVGIGTDPKTNAAHAFLFINGKLTDLNSLIPAGSDWILRSADAINNRGQIVGFGVSPSGYGHAYLLTPTAAPEPTSLTLLSVGALGLAGHAWRKRRRAGPERRGIA